MKKRVELLAPAGNYQAFIGAINAGADAVYLGGEKFGARAFADNFTSEEICRALRYAHIFGKKIYLTVNTLIKEKEFTQLYDYISPFYEEGLDGVIIQDLGVWQYIKETFPDMALHASTQMAITGEMGASLLKENGASRIVPARELSLEEVKNIKKATGLEIECFVHGAMCYSYSGQCLFSSILGGRSGNRGRCAQPCRLPYHVYDPQRMSTSRELYLLSLKDICTVEFIPALIEAGIDSFKIEGRMKRPEYAAGVTSVYRKYIDLYYQYGKKSCQVRKNDMDKLKKLYIRSALETGYYERTNGKEMITYIETGYLNADEDLCREISDKYLGTEKKCPVTIKAVFHTGEAACLQIEGGGVKVSVCGEIVARALKKPMDKETVFKHLGKVGNSHVQINSAEIILDNDSFIPVGQLNELRRTAVREFEDRLIIKHKLTLKRHMFLQDTLQKAPFSEEKSFERPQLHVLVQSDEQLQAVCQYTCDRLYFDSDYYMSEIDHISRCLEEHPEFAIYLALPYVIRAKDMFYFRRLLSILDGAVNIKGFLVRNLESLSWVRSLRREYDIVTDAGLYCYNSKAMDFLFHYGRECYLPYELNGKECRNVLEQGGQRFQTENIKDAEKVSMIVYGTIPMMISANCLKKTSQGCPNSAETQTLYLIDRYREKFPVFCNCGHCYNVIYNSLPYSLHQRKKEIDKLGIFAKRLDFVGETGEQTAAILAYYTGKSDTFPAGDYTTGHYKRGVD
ncbi:MAG: U32 family peptidase [Roseburia sp.]|nr:U32 family peptidase [Roseburia sp.]MCM1241678.1 U32 family peptidase [Roseburia sp.]